MEHFKVSKELGNFKDSKVIETLIEALTDPTFGIHRKNPIYRQMGRSKFEDAGPVTTGRFYSIRNKAAKSLNKIIGHNNYWGPVYNEDHKTWAEWFNTKKRYNFSPKSITRTEKEKEILIEFLFHYYMSRRVTKNVRVIADDLKPLGKTVIPMIIKNCNHHIAKAAIWETELKTWTKQLLQALPSKDASELAETIKVKKK